MLIVSLNIQIHCTVLLRVMCSLIFQSPIATLNNKIKIYLPISDILDKHDCTWTPIFIIKSEYSLLSLLTFHKVSIKYVINLLYRPQQGLCACMIQYEFKNQSMIIRLAIGLCLITSFNA